MRRIRFMGLVRLANGLQRELGSPVTVQRREQLHRQVTGAVEFVERTLRIHGASRRAIPGPSRRAYDFLRTVNLEAVATVAENTGDGRAQHVTVSGLRSAVEQIAERLAQPAVGSDAIAEARARIGETLGSVESHVQRRRLGPDQLSPRTRECFAWLRFLAVDGNLARYVEAVGRAATVLQSFATAERWPQPIRVHFRPTQSVFRVNADSAGTRVLLPTPLVTCDEAALAELARAMFGRRRRSRNAVLHSILLSEPYQELHAELESLGGVVEETRGMVHDLEESFARVNTGCFVGQMPRPRLTWNHSITGWKFGHYNYSTDTVMISRALDRPDVPAFVVDHVMHHELLHKKHGLRWRGDRGHAHTAEFRAEERSFPRYKEAEEFIRRLAAR